ncbi:MAG: hypothetical protein DMF68_15970 [Acidobacteria bacterium]|nr:MAG: hypothetical protein DMF68_15970 [Acidobacteriota bacterium]
MSKVNLMKKLIQAILSFVICSFLIFPVLANQRTSRKVQVTGIYSSLRYVEDAGDVVGMEIFISNSRDGYHATVQIAEGVMFAPILIEVQVKGTNIEFTLPESAGQRARKFLGQLTANGITGKFQDDVKSTFLKRKNSYWQ